MDEKIRKKYKKAGRIAREALEYGASLIKEGTKYLEIAEKIEGYIINKGAKLAFPTNISVNEIAAHYTPSIDDDKKFEKGDTVKIDVGAHIDGCIGDTAKTIEVGTNEYGKMIEACENALKSAIELVKPGIKVSEIGSVIEKKIKSRGFVPIDNLSGHSMEPYRLHAGLSIPNVGKKNGRKVEEGKVIAIEPFATNGEGHVRDGKNGNIYSFSKYGSVRNAMARKLLKSVKDKPLPFAERWLRDVIPKKSLRPALLMLSSRRLIHPYRILIEKGIVAQAERTIIITNDGCEITTIQDIF